MKRMIGIFCVLSIVVCFQISAYAQDDVKAKLRAMKPKDFPTQPIEFVVVYPAGGGMDVVTRVLAKHVEKLIDQRVVVVNKTGGAGLIGHTYLCSQAKNDGYTVGVVATFLLHDELLRANGKWSYADLEPLAFINDDPFNWIVSTKGPFKDKSLRDVVDMAKKSPEALKMAVVPETPVQFLVEHVEHITGAKFISVPFQGGKPGVIALLGGHVDVAYSQYGEFKDYLEAGQVKDLALTGDRRFDLLPNVPTFNEVLGVKDVLWSAWRYAGTPKGVPRDRFRYLEAAIDAALHDPECIKDNENSGNIVGRRYMNAKQTAEDLDKQYKSFKEFFIKTGRISK